jgi:signal transduction histidine kinase
LAVLCRNLSQGFHSAAQPLAILRASLDSSLTEAMTAGDLRRLAANSAEEVERVCRLFTLLQQFVTVESVSPSLSEMSIVPLLERSIDGVVLLFDNDGIFLNATLPPVCPPVLIDRARTLQALSSVLLAAHAVSGAQDSVELAALPSFANTVRVTVRNPDSKMDTMDAELRLSIALAEAHIRSQQGGFSWTLKPFTVQIEFPHAPAA